MFVNFTNFILVKVNLSALSSKSSSPPLKYKSVKVASLLSTSTFKLCPLIDDILDNLSKVYNLILTGLADKLKFTFESSPVLLGLSKTKFPEVRSNVPVKSIS